MKKTGSKKSRDTVPLIYGGKQQGDTRNGYRQNVFNDL
jgi:hypothetical protein